MKAEKKVPDLTLAPDPDSSFFEGIVFFEPIIIDKLIDLLKTNGLLKKKSLTKSGHQESNWMSKYDSQRSHVAAIISQYSAIDNAIKVKYQFANRGTSIYGRVYPLGSKSGGEMSGNLRDYCFHKQWTALDIENAHPNILYQVLKLNGFEEFTFLANYCSNRNQNFQEVMNEYNVDRTAAKYLFIRLLYLGSFQGWAKDNGLSSKKPTKFIDGFSEEMFKIAEVLMKHNADMHATLKPNKKSKKVGRTPKAQKADEGLASRDQLVAYFCAEHERCVLKLMFDFLVTIGLINIEKVECMLRYDGIDLPLASLDGKDIGDVLNRMSDYVFKHSGFKLMMTEKAYKENYELQAMVNEQLDYEKRIPDEFKARLDNDFLTSTSNYNLQKYYFEKFVTTIQNQIERISSSMLRRCHGN